MATGDPGKRAIRANKTCVSCHARKVKCDAAFVGIPCSGCTSRQCAEDCALPVRKTRTRKVKRALPTPNHTTSISATPSSNHSDRFEQLLTPEPLEHRSPHKNTGADLLYLNILNDTVKEAAESSPDRTTSNIPCRSSSGDKSALRTFSWANLSHLDDVDREYLVKKGVFDLPPPHILDALIKTYFEHVFPFSPVINRVDFIRGYQSGTCSMFLLRAILTTATLHAPTDILSACGFSDRSTAQESFFNKARLLHDFTAEYDPLLMLQGSIILCSVMLDRPTDRDFRYWFSNAVRLAHKIDLRNACLREDRPRKVLKLYRRLWWALYFIDIFHIFLNSNHSTLLDSASAMNPRTEEDWDTEDISDTASSGLLSPMTPQQKALPTVYCDLSRILGKCLSTLKDMPLQDPRHIMDPLDAWRRSLLDNLRLCGNTTTDVYYLHMQVLSYRFECTICRLIRRQSGQQSEHAERGDWAKQRLRSAVLELDTIAMRVLANGTLHEFPISFATTITALLSLHIESALDPSESDLVRSMARISINQTMLVVNQGKDIPVLKRALPVFEEILAKKNLCLVPVNHAGQVPTARAHEDITRDADADASTQHELGAVSSQWDHCELDGPLDVGFLDEWQFGQLDFTGRY